MLVDTHCQCCDQESREKAGRSAISHLLLVLAVTLCVFVDSTPCFDSSASVRTRSARGIQHPQAFVESCSLILRLRGGKKRRAESAEPGFEHESEDLSSERRSRKAKRAAKNSLQKHFVSGGSRGDETEPKVRSRKGHEETEPSVKNSTAKAKKRASVKSRKKASVKAKRTKSDEPETPAHAEAESSVDAKEPASDGESAASDSDHADESMFSSGDEYIDFFKYRLKWSRGEQRKEILRNTMVPDNFMPPQLREIARLVFPLAGTEPFYKKMRRDWIADYASDGTPIFREDTPKAFSLSEDAVPIPGLPSQEEMWKMSSEQLMGLDDASAPTVRKAIERQQRNATAGPDWFHLPRGPDLSTRSDLRAALKLLSRRQDWDPNARFKSLGWEKKGDSTKSPYKISYPKFFQEGVVALHPWDRSQNLDRRTRKLSLAEQIMADPAIRHHLHRRFKKKMTIAGGWHPKKGERLEWEVKKREKRVRLKAPRERSLAHQDAMRELRRGQRYLKEARGIGVDPLSQRVLPKMPSQGGTGKSPEQLKKEWEAGAEERIKRARKKREEQEKRRKAKGIKKRKVDRARSRALGRLKKLKKGQSEALDD